jgi:hypothetical protein
VIGDLPYTMMLFVAAGAAWLVYRGSLRTASP